jgi:hypothetical protein
MARVIALVLKTLPQADHLQVISRLTILTVWVPRRSTQAKALLNLLLVLLNISLKRTQASRFNSKSKETNK